MVLGETVRRVKWQNAYLPGNGNTHGVHVWLFVSNLDEAIPGDGGQLAHLPEGVLFGVVLFPHLV